MTRFRFVALLTLAASTLGVTVGCGRKVPQRFYRSEWRVENGTGDGSIRIVAPPHSYIRYMYSDEWVVNTVEDTRGGHDFAMLMECWRGWDEANISFEVLSADGTPLATWRYAERDGEGRQFFDPARWSHSTTTENTYYGEVSVNVWTFEILPGDITPTESQPEPQPEPDRL